MNLEEPIKLKSVRAWRTYIGGKLIDEMHGRKDAKDGNFPEEWLMSTVAARNAGRENMVEGLSIIEEDDQPLLDLINSKPKEVLGFEGSMGVLVKLIDSAERLTVQVHPTREMAKQLFKSQYGKTECWHIFGKRKTTGEEPCIYLGFKEGISQELWKKHFDVQNISEMLNCLHKFNVEAGDTFLIKGGVPHAIGAGCFLAEIQEPTDYTIRTERVTPSGLPIADFMCHQGLGFEKMFDCFSYKGEKYESVYKQYHIKPQIQSGEGYKKNILVDYTHTPMFKLESIEIKNIYTVIKSSMFSGIYVLSGKGEMCGRSICKGDQFFLTAQCEDFNIKNTGQEQFIILRYYGPKREDIL